MTIRRSLAAAALAAALAVPADAQAARVDSLTMKEARAAALADGREVAEAMSGFFSGRALVDTCVRRSRLRVDCDIIAKADPSVEADSCDYRLIITARRDFLSVWRTRNTCPS